MDAMDLRTVIIILILVAADAGAKAQSSSSYDTCKIECYLSGKPSGSYWVKDLINNPIFTTNVPGLRIVKFSFYDHLWCSDMFGGVSKREGNKFLIRRNGGEIGYTISLDSVTLMYKGVERICKAHGSWRIRRRHGECQTFDWSILDSLLRIPEQPDETEPLDHK